MTKPWKKLNAENSLAESFSSVKVPVEGGFWKKLLAFAGPGLMVAVGYMDPGNWATDIAGGAQFGYTLLSVILFQTRTTSPEEKSRAFRASMSTGVYVIVVFIKYSA